MDNFLEDNITNAKLPSLFTRRQYLFAIACVLQTTFCGTLAGFTSLLFSQLKANKEIDLSVDQISWIASIMILLIIATALTSGVLLDWLGRKKCLICSSCLGIIAVVTLYCSNSFALLFASRVWAGSYIGLTYSTLVSFAGEVMHPCLRPFALVGIALGGYVGVLFSQFLGSFLHWRNVSLIISCIGFFNLLTVFYFAESYIWLINKNQIGRARIAFTWFRGYDIDAKNEFIAALDTNSKANSSWKEKLKFCCSKAVIKPFLVTAMLFATIEFSGDNAIIFYTADIMETISADARMQFYANLFLNILRVVATLLSAVLIKKFSLRWMLISSTYMTSVTLTCVAVFLFLSRLYTENKAYSVMCLVSIVINVFFFAIGLGPLPTVICGEIYPAAVRDVGGAFSSFLSFSSMFIVVKILPHLFVWMHPSFIFLIFAICTFTGATIMCFVLPNTDNKTLKEIEKMYES